MNQKMLIAAALFLLFFPQGNARAEETLKLGTVLDEVEKNNPTLAAARKGIEVFEGQVATAREIPNPEVDVSVTKLPFGGPYVSGDISRDYTLQQTFEIGGKRKLRTQSARANLENQREGLRAQGLDLFKQAKEAYYTYTAANEKFRFTSENLSFQQRFLARVEENFQSGQATLADLSRAKLEASRAYNDVLVARKDAETAKSNLNRLMGHEIGHPLPAPEHMRKPSLSINESSLVREAVSLRPERNAINHQQEGSRADLKLARRQVFTPDIKAQIVYQQAERNDNRNSWGGGLGMTLPLWNRNRGARQSAAAKIESLEIQKDDVEHQIELEVHQAALQIGLSRDQIKLWDSAVEDATEAARIAQQRYLEGEVDLSIFFQSRRDLVGTTLQYLDSLKDYYLNVAALERAVGEELEKR